MSEKIKLQKKVNIVSCVQEKKKIENKLASIDDQICKLTADKNAAVLRESLNKVDNTDGQFSQLSMWKLKSFLCPKLVDSQMAKQDETGKLVTAPSMLKKLYLNTYQNRLKNRDMKEELLDLHSYKMNLWKSTLESLQKKTTDDWTMADLDKVLKSLKNNRTRDPMGLINEIFKPGTIGRNMKLALLGLLNQIKTEQKLPELLQIANITTIYKNKGSRQCLDNDRGIFVVSSVRMILDSLIYNDKYATIDDYMTNSNIGARKQRNIRDHLFILYGVINSVVNGQADPVDLQIYDVEKCFDSLWLKDCMLDLVDTLPETERDNKVSLIYHLNQKSYVSVKTPFGMTKRVLFPNIVMQGGKWGPLKCANSMDKIGGKCIKTGRHLYSYKGVVKIMPLAMIDDLLVISECGSKSVGANIFINTEIEMKKLKLHTPTNQGKTKCHNIHIGKNLHKCSELFVHDFKMENVEHDTYLGDVISKDGKNTKNVEARTSKGLGILGHIMDVLKRVNFGGHYFKIAITLREAMLVGGILTNSEVWYGLKTKDIEKLEEIDRLLLRQIFQVAHSCPIEALYLETGTIPFRFIIKARRLNYLHHILTRNHDEMISKIFYAQWENVTKNDWAEQIKDDLSEFGLSHNLAEIRSCKKSTFKNKIRKRSRELAFDYLMKLKRGHSKLDDLHYNELVIQGYLDQKSIPISTARVIFKTRVRMTQYWKNFKGNRVTQICQICKDSTSIDEQQHSFAKS